MKRILAAVAAVSATAWTGHAQEMLRDHGTSHLLGDALVRMANH